MEPSAILSLCALLPINSISFFIGSSETTCQFILTDDSVDTNSAYYSLVLSINKYDLWCRWNHIANWRAFWASWFPRVLSAETHWPVTSYSIQASWCKNDLHSPQIVHQSTALCLLDSFGMCSMCVQATTPDNKPKPQWPSESMTGCPGNPGEWIGRWHWKVHWFTHDHNLDSSNGQKIMTWSRTQRLEVETFLGGYTSSII